MEVEENQNQAAPEPTQDNTQTTGTEPAPAQSDTVPLEQATHDEVKNALQLAMEAEERGEVAEPGSSAEPEPANPPKDPQTSGSEPVAEPQPAGATPPTQATQTAQPPVQGPQADEERRRNIESKKELFFRERTNWLNSVRNQNQNAKTFLENRKNQLSQGLEDLWQSDVRTATQREREITEIDAKLQNLEHQDLRAKDVYDAQVYFAGNVDPDVTIDDLVNVLKSDGTPEQYLNHFRANPWEFTTPEALVQMGRRAMDLKVSQERYNDNKVLAQWCLQLQKENKELKARPGQMIKKVQQHLNAPVAVNGASAANSKAPVNVDVTRLSSAELKAGIAAGNIAQ